MPPENCGWRSAANGFLPIFSLLAAAPPNVKNIFFLGVIQQVVKSISIAKWSLIATLYVDAKTYTNAAVYYYDDDVDELKGINMFLKNFIVVPIYFVVLRGFRRPAGLICAK